MKKYLLSALLILLPTASYASWWGSLSGGTRAAIIAGSALYLGKKYNESEFHHKQQLKKIDTQVRRDFQKRAAYEEAVKKYEGVSGANYSSKASREAILNTPGATVIQSDANTEIIQLPNGQRVMFNK